MNNGEAISLFHDMQGCRHQALHTNDCGDCERCQFYHTQEQLDEAVDLAISALEKQEQDRWRPCSVRLPEDYSDVLVWFEYFRYGSYNRLYQAYGIGNYSAQYDAWTVNHETGWNKLRVIAWKPLPEPYTEEEA